VGGWQENVPGRRESRASKAIRFGATQPPRFFAHASKTLTAFTGLFGSYDSHRSCFPEVPLPRHPTQPPSRDDGNDGFREDHQRRLPSASSLLIDAVRRSSSQDDGVWPARRKISSRHKTRPLSLAFEIVSGSFLVRGETLRRTTIWMESLTTRQSHRSCRYRSPDRGASSFTRPADVRRRARGRWLPFDHSATRRGGVETSRSRRPAD